MKNDGFITPLRLLQILSYDSATGRFVWKARDTSEFPNEPVAKTWNARFSGKPAFIGDNGCGYAQSRMAGRNYLAHRVAWAIHFGVWPDGQIDHINGNRRDNRITNLRVVTNQENQKNRRLSSRSTSGITGVYWNKRQSKWQSYITIDGKAKYLGLFCNKSDAAIVRKNAEANLGFHQNHGRP